MTLYEFNALDEMEQAEALWESEFIADRHDEEHNILLYQRDSFYIEVFHHRQLNVIRRIRSFSSTTQLEPYINNINVINLINQRPHK